MGPPPEGMGRLSFSRRQYNELWQCTSEENMTTKAVILVGGPGKGTRFRPLSLDIPKPLFPIAGFPLVQVFLTAFLTQKFTKNDLLSIISKHAAEWTGYARFCWLASSSRPNNWTDLFERWRNNSSYKFATSKSIHYSARPDRSTCSVIWCWAAIPSRSSWSFAIFSPICRWTKCFGIVRSGWRKWVW